MNPTSIMWLILAAIIAAIVAAEVIDRRQRDREVLDCGCPADGRPTYFCITCGHTRCAEHRDDIHDCTAHMGQEAP